MLISASLVMSVPVKLVSIVNVIVTVDVVPAGINGIGLFSTAFGPTTDQLGSFKINPAGM